MFLLDGIGETASIEELPEHHCPHFMISKERHTLQTKSAVANFDTDC